MSRSLRRFYIRDQMALIYFDSNSFYLYYFFRLLRRIDECFVWTRIESFWESQQIIFPSFIPVLFFIFLTFFNSLLIVACRRKRWLWRCRILATMQAHISTTYTYCFFCCSYTKSQGTIVECIRRRNNFWFHCLWTTTDRITWEAQPRGFAMYYALQLDDVRLDERTKQ
jgi:hypothetical protein